MIPREPRLGVPDAVVKLAHQHLGITDEQAISLILATAVSVHYRPLDPDDDPHDPLWPMLIGPSSGGKSTILKLLSLVPHTLGDDITHASLLYYEAPKGDGQGKQGGILPRMGDHGFLIVPDLSVLLSGSRKGDKDHLFSALRKVYDGEYTRDMYGAHLHWRGRCTMLAACTSAIDSYSAYQAELGTRFIYLRLRQRDLDTRLSVPRHSQRATHRVSREARDLVNSGIERLPHTEVPDKLADFIMRAAETTAYGRTSVPRDGFSGEVSGVVETEERFRFENQLLVLARCLLALDCTEVEAAGICARVARDSMPVVRRDLLAVLSVLDTPTPTATLARGIGSVWNVTHRNLEDLELAGVVNARSAGISTEDRRVSLLWEIAPEFSDLIRPVFNDKY